MNHNRNLNSIMLLKGFIQPNIGLDSDVRSAVVEILNNTLANETILAVKTRNAHWNIRGESPFEQYHLFDSQYDQLDAICNEIAERARMLGGIAIGSLQEFLKYSRLGEQPGDYPTVLRLITDHETSIRFIREDARKCTEEYQDEGTFDLLISVMRLHEKMTWILRAYIDHNPVYDENQIRS